MALDLSGLSQQDQINKAADFAGVSPSVFTGMLHTESNGNNAAVSPAGAEGAFQVMPSTRATWEGRLGRTFDPHDFSDSLTLAAHTLKENLEATGGNVADALRMYNAGPDRAKWNNPETRAYAAKVLGSDPSEMAGTDATSTPHMSPDAAWGTSAYDLKSALDSQMQGKSKEYLSDVEKGIVSQAGTEAAINAVVTGNGPAAADAALDARTAVKASPTAITDNVISTLGQQQVGTGNDTTGWAGVQVQAGASAQQFAKDDAVTVRQKFSAAFDQNTLTAAIGRAIANAQTFDGAGEYDPGFHDTYMGNIDKIEAGMDSSEVSSLREARNPQDLRRIQFQIDNDRRDAATVAAGSSTTERVLLGLAAGTADPFGWVAGLGIGKVAQLVGIGSKAAFAAGRIGRGIAYSGIEGAAGNVLMTATLDAAGQHQSINDYGHAAGFGFMMGAGFSALHLKGPAKQVAEEQMADLGKNMQDTAAVANADLYTKAQAKAGPNATPADIERAADQVQLEQVQSLHDTITADAPMDEKMAPPLAAAEDGSDRLVPAGDPGVTAAPVTNTEYKLPQELGGATPNYSRGGKKFKLDFDNDVDKAAYIVAQKNPSKRDADYLSFVMKATGEDEAGARAYGVAVRSSIGDMAKTAEPGTLKVESHFNTTQAQDTADEVVAHATTAKGAQFSMADKPTTMDTSGLGLKGGQWVREVTAHDPESGEEVGRLIYTNYDRPPSVRVNASHQRQGVATAMLKMAKEQGGVLGEDATGRFASGAEATRSPEGQAFRGGANESGVSLKYQKRTVFSKQEEPSASIEGDAPAQSEDVNSPASVRRRTLPYDQVRQTVFGDVHDENRLFPRPEVNSGKLADISNPDTLPGALLNTKDKLDAVVQAHNLDTRISDPTERHLVAETIARSERVVAANPIDESVKPALQKIGWEATSTSLLSDKSPVSKAAGILLLENPEGVAGRRATAAITANMREKVYVGEVLTKVENEYLNYRRENGGSAAKDYLNGELRRSFDKEVYELRDRQFMGKPERENVPESVRNAAKLYNDGYKQMNDDQIYAGTVGSARLTAGGVDGYQPRRMSAGMVASLDGPRLRAAVSAVAEEFQKTSGMDSTFANEFAVKYLERARIRAKGAYDVSVNMHDPQSASMMRDSLRALSLSEEQVNAVVGRFSRGGASHTKNRIDMDLTTSYPDGAGGNLRMMDLMNTDNSALYRSYARRVAGETALAKYGIMGERGLDLMKTAMRETGASNAALRAFDQVAAEFLGKPFGTHVGKWADNAMMVTSALRLGGMGIAQFAEYTNGIASIGVSGVFKAIGAMPRLYSEIRSGKPSALLASLAQYGGDIGHEEYRMHGMYDVNHGYELFGQETLNVVDKAVRLGSHFNRVASFQRGMMSLQQRGVSEQIVQKSLQYIKDGIEDRALKDMGFTPDVVSAFKSEMHLVAKFGPRGVKSFDITKLSNTDAAHAYMQAVYRGAAQIIQHTYIGEQGKWAHDGWLRLLTQFRGYGLLATQKQWGRQAHAHGTAKALGYLFGAMSIAVPIQMARIEMTSINRKDRDAFLDEHMSPLALGRSTMNYLGATGVLGDVLDIGSSALGLSVTGGRSGNTSGFIGGQILPAAGAANDIVKSVTGLLSIPANMARGKTIDKGRIAHDLLKSLPGAGLPYLQAAVNSLNQ